MKNTIKVKAQNRGLFLYILFFLGAVIGSAAYAEDEKRLPQELAASSIGKTCTIDPVDVQQANNICNISWQYRAATSPANPDDVTSLKHDANDAKEQNISRAEQETSEDAMWYGIVMGVCKRIENNLYYNVVPYVAGIVGNQLNMQLTWPTKVVELLDAKFIGSFSAKRLEEMNEKFLQFKNANAFSFIGVPLGKGLAELLWYKDAKRVQAVIVCEEVANVVSLVLREYLLPYLPEGQDVWLGVFINKDKILVASTMASIGLCLYGYDFIGMRDVGAFAAGGLLV